MHPSGKLAVFKAKVKGDPKPEVSWRRAKGLVSDKEKFLQKYDKSTGEHILEVSEWTAPEWTLSACLRWLICVSRFTECLLLNQTRTNVVLWTNMEKLSAPQH